MMNVTIDEKNLSEAINNAVTAAVTDGISSWDMKNAVSKAAERSINTAQLPQRVEAALDAALAEHIDELVITAVQEALPAIASAASMAIKTLAARMIYGLRNGPSSYDQEEMRIFQECIAAVGAKLPSPEEE